MILTEQRLFSKNRQNKHKKGSNCLQLGIRFSDGKRRGTNIPPNQEGRGCIKLCRTVVNSQSKAIIHDPNVMRF